MKFLFCLSILQILITFVVLAMGLGTYGTLNAIFLQIKLITFESFRLVPADSSFSCGCVKFI